jgi:hypothetical protein
VNVGAEIDKPTIDHRTPLCIATQHENLEIVMLIENGTEIDKALPVGITILIVTVFQGHCEAID